jgi:ADP-heptose:LPS heptosyltransferase
VKYIPSVHKISSSGDLQCQKPDERSEGNHLYTKRIDTGSFQNFELEKHKQFTSELIGSSEPDFQFHLPSVPDFSIKSQRPYVVFFPGAGAALRQWNPEKFALVLDFILAETPFDVLIAGSEGERTLGETIAGKPSDRVQNLCGKTSLPELVGMIKNARLLISNESSAVHMAAFSGVETLCLSNGNHYGRFNPYQNQGLPYIQTVYPESIHLLSEAERLQLYYEGSTLPIQEISVDQVIEALKQTRAFHLPM